MAKSQPKIALSVSRDIPFDKLVLKRLTGLFSIVITSPRTVEAVRKNPLGIYVHAFNWSQDVTTGEPK